MIVVYPLSRGLPAKNQNITLSSTLWAREHVRLGFYLELNGILPLRQLN